MRKLLQRIKERMFAVIMFIMLMLSILFSPFIGKGLDNTTKALLYGLSTDEQINTVADVVDTNKVEVDNLKLIIEAQTNKIEEQRLVIDSTKIESSNANKISECAELKSQYIMCNNPDFEKSESSFLDSVKYMDDKSALKNYNICQDLFKKCN